MNPQAVPWVVLAALLTAAVGAAYLAHPRAVLRRRRVGALAAGPGARDAMQALYRATGVGLLCLAAFLFVAVVRA